MPVSTKVATVAEHVVLLDERGRAAGTAEKATAHTCATAFHLRVLLPHRGRVTAACSSRAGPSRSAPGRAPGRTGAAATRSSARPCATPSSAGCATSSGLHVVRASVALPDFAYRAEMPDGTVEHELCPVVIAEVAGPITPDPDEVDDLVWLPWADVVERGDREPWSLSPWSVEQVRQLAELGVEPRAWLDGPAASLAEPLLDRPVGGARVAPVLVARRGRTPGRSQSSTAPCARRSTGSSRRRQRRPWPSTPCCAR